MRSVASVGQSLRMAPNPLEDDMDARDRIGKGPHCPHMQTSLACLRFAKRHQPTSRAACDGITAAHQFSAVLLAIGVATTNLHAGCEQAFTRHMIYLQPRTVRILKQHRIVARGEAVLAWLMNNFCGDFDEEIIRLIDIAALTRAKTVMM